MMVVHTIEVVALLFFIGLLWDMMTPPQDL
jgi:hypothetical protein